ncbi:hypothetical protein FGF1_32410 [Flavobacteriaceae bacterium GF1]
MKKVKILLGIVVVAIALGCEGPQGPPGRDGVNGANGADGADAERASVFEQAVTFAYDVDNNLWSSEVLSFGNTSGGDVFLAYVSLDENLFTSLPASFFDEFGEFQYVFDHDADSVQFQIIGDNDLSDLGVEFTDNIVTRVAIIPGDLVAEFNVNGEMDIISLMKQMNISETDIIFQ